MSRMAQKIELVIRLFSGLIIIRNNYKITNYTTKDGPKPLAHVHKEIIANDY